MKYLRWLAVIVFLVMAWNFDLGSRVIDGDANVDIADPAVELMTQTHSKAYGGIDRWAFPGLEAWRLIARLKTAGFSCTLPQDPGTGGTPKSGQHTLKCSQERGWPLSRQLLLSAVINYESHGGRLVAASAHSELKPGAWRAILARPLRATGLMEPAELRVRGMQANSTEELARIVADTLLTYSWDSFCGDTIQSTLCRSHISTRRKNGFPALPAGAWPASDIASVQNQLRGIGFVATHSAAASADHLLLRLEGEQLWLDMERDDLAGQHESLALEINPVGGQVTRLLLTGKTGRREFALAGKATTFNDEKSRQWLFPLPPGTLPERDTPNPAEASAHQEFAEAGIRAAIWLLPPGMDDMRDRYARFSQQLASLDPLFHPLLLRAYMDMLLQDSAPEIQLQLQPALQSADRMALALSKSGITRLLTPTENAALIHRHYQKQPLARAAWALQECETSFSGSPEIEPACWQGFMLNAPDAAALLRQDLARLSAFYAGLDPANPVQLRLQRLAMAFARSGAAP